MNARRRPASQPQVTTTALVVIQTADEREYIRLRALITLRKTRIEKLEAEVNPLVAALEKFEWAYKSQMGTLQHELHSLQETIDRLRERAARIHARMAADPHGLLGDLFSKEELIEIGEMFGIEIPVSWFPSEEYEREQAREGAWRYFGEDGEEFDPRQRRREQHAPRLSANEEREIRQLYLQLARRFHPDLAATDDQRRECQEMMSRINTAWHDRDLATLRAFSQDILGEDHRTSYKQRCLWAQRECVRLDQRIQELETRLTALRASDTFPLWFNPTLGTSVINRRAAALRIDIAHAERESDEAKDYFRQALHYYAAASPV